MITIVNIKPQDILNFCLPSEHNEYMSKYNIIKATLDQYFYRVSRLRVRWQGAKKKSFSRPYVGDARGLSNSLSTVKHTYLGGTTNTCIQINSLITTITNEKTWRMFLYILSKYGEEISTKKTLVRLICEKIQEYNKGHSISWLPKTMSWRAWGIY